MTRFLYVQVTEQADGFHTHEIWQEWPSGKVVTSETRVHPTRDAAENDHAEIFLRTAPHIVCPPDREPRTFAFKNRPALGLWYGPFAMAEGGNQ
mgnify:CR=1 FL=1